MIYTITLNPAIDHIILSTKSIELGMTNYYDQDYQVIGGKGINAGIILNNLGSVIKAIGIMGEDNKDIFLNKFKEINLNSHFIFNPGKTRINYKIKHIQTHQETELNGLGFNANPDLVQALLNYLNTSLTINDIVVATGSVARGIDKNIYQKIGSIVNAKKAIFIVDAANELLKKALATQPYLIKPNLEEICSTLELEFKPNFNFEEVNAMIEQLKTLGAQNILLSNGSKGSTFFSQTGEVYQVGIAQGKLVNSVGAGDSMLAGFIYGLEQNLPIKRVLQYAAAAGGATAFTEWLAQKSTIEALLDSIVVSQL